MSVSASESGSVCTRIQVLARVREAICVYLNVRAAGKLVNFHAYKCTDQRMSLRSVQFVMLDDEALVVPF